MTDTTTQPWLEAARAVIAHNSFLSIDVDTGAVVETEWEGDEVANTNAVVLDLVTAGMLVQIHDALSPRNQEKFASMSLLKAVDVGWKLVTRSKEKQA